VHVKLSETRLENVHFAYFIIQIHIRASTRADSNQRRSSEFKIPVKESKDQGGPLLLLELAEDRHGVSRIQISQIAPRGKCIDPLRRMLIIGLITERRGRSRSISRLLVLPLAEGADFPGDALFRRIPRADTHRGIPRVR